MANTNLQKHAPTISCEHALSIARIDAETAYRDLSVYRIEISLEEKGWVVDYELNDRNLQGGGSHYAIDTRTGVILSKRCEQ